MPIQTQEELMSLSKRSIAGGSKWFVLFLTLILALFSIVGPTVVAEGGGPIYPPNGGGEDTLGIPEPSLQPDNISFFEMIGLYFETIF